MTNTSNETKTYKEVKRYRKIKALSWVFGSIMILGCVGTITFGTLWCQQRKATPQPTPTPVPTITYTVTFDLDGGSIPGLSGNSMVVNGNTTFGMLPVPMKTGFSFIGYTNNGTLVVPTAVINTNVSLKANWEAGTTPTTNHQVTFNLDGGTIAGLTGNTMSVAPGTTFGMLPTPTKLGVNFVGWSSGGQTMNPTAEIVTDLEVKALWTETTKLNLDTMGSISEMTGLYGYTTNVSANQTFELTIDMSKYEDEEKSQGLSQFALLIACGENPEEPAKYPFISSNHSLIIDNTLIPQDNYLFTNSGMFEGGYLLWSNNEEFTPALPVEFHTDKSVVKINITFPTAITGKVNFCWNCYFGS